jgi:hypothetical protein
MRPQRQMPADGQHVTQPQLLQRCNALMQGEKRPGYIYIMRLLLNDKSLSSRIM